MQEIDTKIIKFLKEHHVLTLATSNNNIPWCCNCFYVFREEEVVFLFTSGEKTRHIEEVRKNDIVAASVVLETKIVGKIQGLQVTGKLIELEGENLSKYKKIYLKRFPIAATFDTKYWMLKVEYMKMTDNRLVFGTKLEWERDAE